MSSSGNNDNIISSGDGGSVQEFSHYDFINAPQFVDFADLDRYDDPNADVFFETHEEKDDFMVPVESISPTIQLLNSNEQNILSTSQNNVNKAVAQAGMDDVKVVYYSSPSTTNNRGSKGPVLSESGGAQLGSLNSSVMSMNSFYTPMGSCEYADKENRAPSPTDSQGSTPTVTEEIKICKKLSYSDADVGVKENGELVEDVQHNNVPIEPEKMSIQALLDKFSILSDDEEEEAYEGHQNNDSYASPTPTPDKADETLIETILSTPGAVQQQKKVADGSSLSVKSKLDFFQGISLDDSNEEERTKEVERSNEADLVMGVDVQEQFYKNEFPTFPGPVLASDRKQSFLVDPTIGQEVVWNNDDLVNLKNGETSLAKTISNCSSIRSLNEDDENHHFYCSDADDTLTSSFDGYKDFHTLMESDKLTSNTQNLRRASSLSDLNKLQQLAKSLLINKPVTKKVKTALTMPQSPEASRRPTKCRSAAKAPVAFPLASALPCTQSSMSRIPKSSAKTQPSKANERKLVVPYKSKIAAQRVPLKANHYVSLAESIVKFQKNTPDRFRTLPTRGRVPIKRSASCDSKDGEREKSKSPSTITQAPGSSRSRASSASSVGSQSCSSATVKFQGANSMSTNCSKLTSLPKKATVPQPFHFSVTRPRTTVETKETVHDVTFKARPAPKIKAPMAGHSGKDRSTVRVTQAIAPHFASDDRIRERHEKKAQSTQHSPVRVRPVSTHPTRAARNASASGTASANRTHTIEAGPRPATTFKPFSFDRRDQEMLRRKEAKIKQELEEAHKMKEFHANPLPSFTPKLPKKKTAPTTSVHPFHLKSDERGSAYQEMLRLKLAEEEQKLKEIATFHANPPIVLSKPAFEPEHPARPPLEPVEIHLSTEQRALEREQFELHLKQKEMEEEAKRREEQEKQEELLRQEEIENRRQLVHKAKPFRPSKAFQLRASERALTVPHSPAFLPLPSQRRISPSKQNK